MYRSCCAFALVLTVCFTIQRSYGAPNWQNRVLPLPKEMSVSATVAATPDEIRFDIPAGLPDALPLRTARALFNDFARAEADDAETEPLVRIQLSGLDTLPETLRTRLRALPNAAQAYAIVSKAGTPAHVTLAADTPVGLLYAVQTLHQMVLGGQEAAASDETLEIPLPEILDWPDIEQRGYGLGGDLFDLHLSARWKLNFRSAYIKSRVSDAGEIEHYALLGGRVHDAKAFLEACSAWGVLVVPDIGHLGNRWPTLSPPLDEQGKPLDGVTGYCWADAFVQNALANVMEAVADSIDGYGTELTVWLTEHRAETCHCETCAGKNPYLLEAQRTLEAFARLRQRRPEFRLNLMLSQGSQPVEAEILEMVSGSLGEHVGLIYYNGGRTYITDFQPMVPQTLEAYARDGGFLGILPQITPHYSALVPASMPPFILFRAAEYAEKKLGSVRVFFPDRYFYPVNIAALAEYTWNAKGRSTEAFARAYATLTGMDDPEAFAQWIEPAGEAAWVLAETQLFRKIGQANYGTPKVGDPERFEAARALAREALDLAIRSGDPDRFVESLCTLAGLESIVRMQAIDALLAEPAVAAEKLPAELDALERMAVALYSGMHAWHDRVIERKRREFVEPDWGHPILSQFFAEHGMSEWYMMTANALFRTSDWYRLQALLLGIPEAGAGEFTAVELGEWNPEDFDDEGNLFKVFDMDAHVPLAGGSFGVAVDLIDGNDFYFGPVSLETRATDDADWERVVENLNARVYRRRITRKWGGPVSWHDFRFEIPPRPEGTSLRLVLENEQRSGPAGREAVASTGVVALRALSALIDAEHMDPEPWKAWALGNQAP